MTNAPTEVGALAKEHSDSDTNRISTSPRGPQLTCECCLKQFPKTSKKPKRFCSDACRKKEARRRANGHSEVQSPTASVYAPKNPNGSEAYKAKNGNRPLDLLGVGYRWPKRLKLDRETWARIIWCEVGP